MLRSLGSASRPLQASADQMHSLGAFSNKFVESWHADDPMTRRASYVSPTLLQNMVLRFGSTDVGSLAVGDVVMFGPPFLETDNTVNTDITDVEAPVTYVTAEDMRYDFSGRTNVPTYPPYSLAGLRKDFVRHAEITAHVTPRTVEGVRAEWNAQGEDTEDTSRGILMRIMGARTRFFLDANDRPREVGVATRNYLVMVRRQEFAWPTAVGDMFVFERCFMNEPYDVCFDQPLPERVVPLSAEEFATFRPLHGARHHNHWDHTIGNITWPWSPGDPDPEADTLFDIHTPYSDLS